MRNVFCVQLRREVHFLQVANCESTVETCCEIVVSCNKKTLAGFRGIVVSYNKHIFNVESSYRYNRTQRY